MLYTYFDMEFGQFNSSNEYPTSRNTNPENKSGTAEDLKSWLKKKQAETRETDETIQKKRRHKKSLPTNTDEVKPDKNSSKDEQQPESAQQSESLARDLAKEYVSTRKNQLEQRVAFSELEPNEQLALQADLEFITRLDTKLTDPSKEVEPMIEFAYHQIIEEIQSSMITQSTDLTPNTLRDQTAENIDVDNPINNPEHPTVSEVSESMSIINTGPTTEERVLDVSLIGGSTAVANTPRSARPRTIISANSVPNKPESSPRKIRTSTTGALGTLLVGRRLVKNLPPERTSHDVLTNITAGTGDASSSASSMMEQQRITAQYAPIAAREADIQKFAVAQNTSSARKSENLTLSAISLGSTEHSPTTRHKAPLSPEKFTPNRSTNLSNLNESFNTPHHVLPETETRQIRATRYKAEQLSTSDLLQVAAHITLGSTTVRRLYESNQIDRKGLVSLVNESLKGGDIKKVFQKVSLGTEAKRGRAIETRHDEQATPNNKEPTNPAQEFIDKLKVKQVALDPNTPNRATVDNLKFVLNHEPQTKSSIPKITIGAIFAIGCATALAWLLLH